MQALIAPSILSADFTKLGEQIAEAEKGGADWIHVDVMDGHFVPNITIGPLVVEAARRATKLPLDVHLMIENPDRYLDEFVSAGADRLTVHQETCPHLHRSVQRIRELGAQPGVALNPSTPVDTLVEILPFVDLVLVMTVNPGFGGQSFIRESLPKITRLSRLLQSAGLPHVHIEVDGGIDPTTAPAVVEFGANVLVTGSAVFAKGSVVENIQAIRRSLAVDV
ncbi:MAG: ribulose-phosphate 3-epimerase [Gemmatimonadetes bacterium]|nr:ribulose-phosphate 3-epimerase [Gemmatimonadota bacterium]NIO32335.1 ribulose-phosphate 3-epimerase [Gemmatimonadota bacterium]